MIYRLVHRDGLALVNIVNTNEPPLHAIRVPTATLQAPSTRADPHNAVIPTMHAPAILLDHLSLMSFITVIEGRLNGTHTRRIYIIHQKALVNWVPTVNLSIEHPTSCSLR
jgi:hypothetical protein